MEGFLFGSGNGDSEDGTNTVLNSDVTLAVGVFQRNDGLEVSVSVAAFNQSVYPVQGAPVSSIGHDSLVAAHLFVDGIAGVHGPVDIDEAFGVDLVHEGQIFLHAGLTQLGDDGVGFGIDDVVKAQTESGSDFALPGAVAGEGDHAGVVLDGNQQIVELIDGVGLGVAVLFEDIGTIADTAGVHSVVYLGNAVDGAVIGGHVVPAQIGDGFLGGGELLKQTADVHQSALSQEGLIHRGAQLNDVILGAGSDFQSQLVVVAVVVILNLVAGVLLEQLGNVVGVHVPGHIGAEHLDAFMFLSEDNADGQNHHQSQNQGYNALGHSGIPPNLFFISTFLLYRRKYDRF